MTCPQAETGPRSSGDWSVNRVSDQSVIWPRACHSTEAWESNLTTCCLWFTWCEWNRPTCPPTPPLLTDTTHPPTLSLSLAGSTMSTCLCIHVEWVIHACGREASQPTRIHTLSGSHPASPSIPAACIHSYWVMITTSAWWPTKPPHSPALRAIISCCLRLCLLSVCQFLSPVSLWEANLSAFPMMCLGNLFPGQPGYQILSQRLLAGASFVYTFHISARM